MKKTISLLLAAALCFSVFVPAAFAAVTMAPAPGENAALLFTKKLGSGYRNAPTPLAVHGNALYVVSGKKLYKLHAKTGEILAETVLESVSTFTAAPPTVYGGRVFIPLDDGIVQAFDEGTLAPVWTYTDPLGGQGLTAAVCEDGRLYTGFWNGETEAANFVCLPTEGAGEQTAVWTFSALGGFYRTEALLRDGYVLFGSDNGAREFVNPEAPGTVFCLDKQTGARVSTLTIPGDIRAGLGTDPATGDLYAASKYGALCRFTLTETGDLRKQAEIALPGGMTVAPEVWNGRLYAACMNGAKGLFLTLEPDTLQTVYTAELPGVPQGNLLVSARFNGEARVYFTCNQRPGGVYMITDAPGRTAGAAATVFEPDEALAQYCFCPLAAGEDGALYYKNDSGTIFALRGDPSGENGFLELLRLWQNLLRLLRTLLKGRAAA